MQGVITQRIIQIEGSPLEYSLERKNVKNLNLHVRKDGSVYVSANMTVPEEKIDEFLISKGSFIRNAQNKFKEQEQYKALPKQYVSGETFYVQGRALRLKVTQATRDKIYSDGVYLFLDVKDQQDATKKERMVKRFLDKQCKAVFGEIVEELYPVFQKYGVAPPILRIRNIIVQPLLNERFFVRITSILEISLKYLRQFLIAYFLLHSDNLSLYVCRICNYTYVYFTFF